MVQEIVRVLGEIFSKIDWDCILKNKCKEPKPKPYLPPPQLWFDPGPDSGPDEKVRPSPPKFPGIRIPDDWTEWAIGKPFGMKPHVYVGFGRDPLGGFGIDSATIEFEISFE